LLHDFYFLCEVYAVNKIALTHNIKQRAKEIGFDSCGVAMAESLEEEARLLEAWLNQGLHGKMAYMENHFEKRVDPRKLVAGARSVISLSYNYFTDKQQVDAEAPKLAMYAFGQDYHEVVREKLELLFDFIKTEAGEASGRCFVDSAPVLEKAWAKRSGVGWLGKNSNILTKGQGSFFFLAEIILDVELEYDSPVKDYCGNCTKCIDACPTDAIYEPYKVDAHRCISYFTIELKDEVLPAEFKGGFENWMFGCDICQQVCPINARARKHNEPKFEPKPELLGMTRRDWEELSEETYRRIFQHSAVKRAKFKGLKRNIGFLKSE
jgi:epoxyqueuosine reductase